MLPLLWHCWRRNGLKLIGNVNEAIYATSDDKVELFVELNEGKLIITEVSDKKGHHSFNFKVKGNRRIRLSGALSLNQNQPKSNCTNLI